ncbi:TolA-binding protein [Mycobacterium sp. MAA66]|uniref:hypothetical protein n=1 Tax=Mycobacterium sp. MAA66 TaxID=3156297 RepID=UPI00351644FF
MGIQPDSSPYGSQTVTGPAWPNVQEEQLEEAATHYQALATKITGSVVPQQHSQLMSLTDTWTGAGSLAASGEATTIIGGHEANGAQAAAIAAKLQSMVAAVIRTKNLVNATAEETQQECMALSAAPFPNVQELIQARIKAGMSTNIAAVTAAATEMANVIGAPPSIPSAGVPPQVEQAAQKAADQANPQDMMQLLSQMGQMAGQLPQMLGQLPQQAMQPLQQLSQPLQQLTSLFTSGGQAKSVPGLGTSPFSAFSNHPLAGGSGAGGGGGMTKAAGLPGGGGGAATRTPLLAKMVGPLPAATAPAGAAAGIAALGMAPVAAGAGGAMGGGGMPMMGHRGESGGRAAALAVPAPLDHDVEDEDADDDW